MIPYDIDPSLHAEKPHEAVLDDGFSPPSGEDPQPNPGTGTSPSTVATPQPVAPGLWEKSGF